MMVAKILFNSVVSTKVQDSWQLTWLTSISTRPSKVPNMYASHWAIFQTKLLTILSLLTQSSTLELHTLTDHSEINSWITMSFHYIINLTTPTSLAWMQRGSFTHYDKDCVMISMTAVQFEDADTKWYNRTVFYKKDDNTWVIHFDFGKYEGLMEPNFKGNKLLKEICGL